jgi:hypothetical protein
MYHCYTLHVRFSAHSLLELQDCSTWASNSRKGELDTAGQVHCGLAWCVSERQGCLLCLPYLCQHSSAL